MPSAVPSVSALGQIRVCDADLRADGRAQGLSTSDTGTEQARLPAVMLQTRMFRRAFPGSTEANYSNGNMALSSLSLTLLFSMVYTFAVVLPSLFSLSLFRR